MTPAIDPKQVRNATETRKRKRSKRKRSKRKRKHNGRPRREATGGDGRPRREATGGDGRPRREATGGDGGRREATFRANGREAGYSLLTFEIREDPYRPSLFGEKRRI